MKTESTADTTEGIPSGSHGNKDCPVCGGRGYTVEPFGDDIEYNGCILCYSDDSIEKKENQHVGQK